MKTTWDTMIEGAHLLFAGACAEVAQSHVATCNWTALDCDLLRYACKVFEPAFVRPRVENAGKPFPYEVQAIRALVQNTQAVAAEIRLATAPPVPAPAFRQPSAIQRRQGIPLIFQALS